MDSNTPLIGLRGHLIDAPAWGRLRSWPDGALIIDQGKIAEVGAHDLLRKKDRGRTVRWVDTSGLVLFPGLVDLHTHLPQYPSIARGESDLLPWLRTSIYPLERDFTGPRSRKEASAFFEQVVRNGTTTVGVYTAVFEDSCDAAFAAAEKVGLRTIMGKLMMDVASYGPHQPKKVVSISLHESKRLCEKWNGAGDGLIDYAFSPRFAVSCSEKLMRGVAELAANSGAYIQTHLAENLEELEKVKNQFTWAKNYTDVYDKCGLLTPKTILGHCIHLTDEEREVLGERGVSVAHCPTANFFLGSGLMPLDKIRAANIRVGLGSDVAAGPELNLWKVMRSAIDTQKARSYYEPGVKPIGPAEAFYMATQGGAEAIGKGDIIGSFDVGKEADLVVMDLEKLLPYRRNQRPAMDLSAEDLVALAVYRGGHHAVIRTYVRGREVHRTAEPGLF
jgi:guanine deaminase